MKIVTNIPMIDDREIAAVTEVLKSGFVTNPSVEGGKYVQEFEKQIKQITGAKHAIAVSSGTTALHAAVMALDIGPGDEVIVPPITFGATAAVVLMQGAQPVFADISLDTFSLDPDDVASKITEKTKAIIAVDLFGVPCNATRIREVIEGKNIAFIEDAAQSIGATYHGENAGNLGDIGCISFYAGKVVMTCEGGAITTNDDELAHKMRVIRTGGMSKPYYYTHLGSNFRLSEVHAAIGNEQMKKIPLIIENRRKNAKFLNEHLKKFAFLQLPDFLGEVESNFYIYTLMLTEHVDKRDEIMERLQEKGIDCRAYYTSPLYDSPLYASYKAPFANTETFSKSTFSLPVHPQLSEEELQYMVDALTEVLEGFQ